MYKRQNIYRALAGGTTMLNILHGSANTIGGQNAVVKLKSVSYTHLTLPTSDLV